jgi:hypothetical protein
MAIHLPGVEALDKPHVWLFPQVTVCMACGVAEFAIPEAELEQLRNGQSPAQSMGIASGQ